MSTIIRYYQIKITMANGKVVQGIRESEIQNHHVIKNIYTAKAEQHFKETYVSEIVVTELSSQSMQVKLYVEKKQRL